MYDPIIPRVVGRRLPSPAERTIVVLTGPRQAGKTTLAQALYPSLRYLSLDAPETREFLRNVRTHAWSRDVGHAVLDEAHKEPIVFEKLKHAFDAREVSFSVLLGSAQILLLRKVSETLAGRVLLYELLPLLLCELAGPEGRTEPPLLARLIHPESNADEVIASAPMALPPGEEESSRRALDHLAHWGGMPSLLHLSEERRRDWLSSYVRTYLERDLADLARLSDLQPFHAFQRLTALRAAQLLSYSELARDAKVSAGTARNYLEYLRISYQAFLLEPYHANLTSRVVKSPKVYWTDVGLLRALSGHSGPLTGPLFENLVISEVVKWIRTTGSSARASFYRTRSGMEVDLLLETPSGLMGLEIKNREIVDGSDAGSLRSLAAAAGARWLCGAVVHRGATIDALDPKHRIWSIPAHRLLA